MTGQLLQPLRPPGAVLPGGGAAGPGGECAAGGPPGAFLDHWHLDTLLCEDGTHPNSAGQALIGRAFRDFAERWEAALQDA